MTVGSVVKAIAILKHLAGSDPQGVNAIARAVELSPSSSFNILKTLVAEEFVDFDAATKLYSLSSVPGRLFASTPDIAMQMGWLRKQLEQLASRYSASCGFWEVRSNRVILSEVVDSPLSTRIHLSIGQRLPAYIGAMGRCIAAHRALSRKDVSAAVAELRWQTPPTPDSYWRDMDAVLKRGWAIDDGNYIRGVATIAATIVDEHEVPTYCLTSTIFSGQHGSDAIAEIGDNLSAVAQETSARLRASQDR